VRQLSETHLKQFGQNVICLRNRVGLTQEKLAEKVEISSRYFQSIEAGKRWPSLGVLLRLKTALECKWADLFLNLE
jgi:DNA-binding XRE family transcriptional regulator